MTSSDKYDNDTTMEEAEDYFLSKTFVSADGQPVRSVCFMNTSTVTCEETTCFKTDDVVLVLGSQGGVITTYSTTTNLIVATFQGGHSHAITALLSFATSKFVSGCKDSMIRVFDFSAGSNSQPSTTTLTGHTNAVTSFSLIKLIASNTDPNNNSKELLLSGSWDGTAKLWDVNNATKIDCVATMAGHENTVCVQGLIPPLSSSTTSSNSTNCLYGSAATGSAGVANGNIISEMKIRLWDIVMDGTSCTVTLRASVTDHMGPIRGLCVDPTTHTFASISNDGTIKIRDCTSGISIMSIQHATSDDSAIPPLVLSIASLGNGNFITVTEDGCSYVWDTTDQSTPLKQRILHPDTLWQVIPSSTSTNDFVTACHDGYVRIFSKSYERKAPIEEEVKFSSQVEDAIAKKSASSRGGGPSIEEISKLPHWNNHQQLVGKSEGQVQLFQKQEGSNTFAIAAQWSSGTWIEVGQVVGGGGPKEEINGVPYDHVFPIEVDTATAGTSYLKIGYNNGDNPFVVAQNFIDQHQLDQNYLAQIADYIRQRVSEQGTTPTLTSLQQEKQQISTTTTTRTFQHFPMKSYLIFDIGTEKSTMNKVVSKINETNAGNITTLEMQLLENLAATLCATNRYHASSISREELGLIFHFVTSWPLEKVFPALDLARLIVLHPDASSIKNANYWQQVIQATLDRCNEMLIGDAKSTAIAVAIPMLSMRLFANAFKGSGSSTAIASNLDSILTVAERISIQTTNNKNIQLAVATVALNASTYMFSSPQLSYHAEKLMSFICIMLDDFSSKNYSEESMTRILIALGTVLLLFTQQKGNAETAKLVLPKDILGNLQALSSVNAAFGQKAKDAANEALSVLSELS